MKYVYFVASGRAELHGGNSKKLMWICETCLAY